MSVTFACSSAGSTAHTCASDLALTRQGNPSHVSQRMQRLACGSFSLSMTPERSVEWPQPKRAQNHRDNC